MVGGDGRGRETPRLLQLLLLQYLIPLLIRPTNTSHSSLTFAVEKWRRQERRKNKEEEEQCVCVCVE